MTNEVTIFENMNVPSFMQGFDNNELAAYMTDSYASLSIKGKVFALVRNGERTVLYSPGTRDVLQRINVIILKAGQHPAKRYYKGTFKDEGESIKPVCFSFNGQHPDPASTEPQCKSCGTCPFNCFGTARLADGSTGKGKACTDYVRLAVCAADANAHDDVFYLAVPAASIKNFNQYVTLLARHKMPIFGVRTEISFDPTVATPKLCFTAVGVVESKAEFNQLLELREGVVTNNIVNGASYAPEAPAQIEAPQPVAQPQTPPTVQQTVSNAADKVLEGVFSTQPAPQAKPAPQPVAQPAPQPAPQQTATVAQDLGQALANLGF